MDILRWVILAALFFGFGTTSVLFLTVHPLKMSRFLLAAVTAFILGIFFLLSAFDGRARWPATGAALISAATAYLLATKRVLAREDADRITALVRKPGDPGKGHTAIVYFTHGEPELYDPIGWINQFREFDEQKIPFIPLPARPFFLYALRNKYLQVGRSNHRSIHQRMIQRLEEAYREAGDHTTQFYLSFLDDHPRPHLATIQALNDGASRIVVAEVFLTNSNHTAEGKHQIDPVMAQFPDIPVTYTGPMHDSPWLQELFLQRANRHNGEVDKSKIGILLVGHGQPDEWDREWPTETEQEISFRLEVLQRLEQDGYLPEQMSLAWMEFKEPKPAGKVEEFVARGVEKILYFPAAISADSIHSQYDIPELVHRARVPAGFPLVNLGAWNDDPLVIRAIQEKCDTALAKIMA